jgi:GNAT superfamily N-acetyltransferase
MRGKGVGKALLLAALEHQKSMGYMYSIIGGSAPDAESFYAKCCGAEIIEGSKPGIYKDMLRKRG